MCWGPWPRVTLLRPLGQPAGRKRRSTREDREVAGAAFVLRRSLTVFVLLVGAANTAPALQRGAQLSTDSTGLVLTETGAVTLPAGMQVREVVVFEGGRVVFWTDTALWDWHETRATPLRICQNQRLHIESAAWRHADRRLVVVDTTAGHAVLLDLADGCRTAKTVLLTRELREAARAGSGLTISESSILALRSVRGRAPQLIVLSLQTGEQRIISIEAKDLRIAEGGSYTPLADGAGLLLTEAAYPFRTIRVSPSGKAQVLLDPANQLPSTMQAVLVRGWIALHLLRTPTWSLVGLADIASDRRLFVVLDPTGVVVRRTELDIAMGFLAVDGVRQTMVAVRDTGIVELVLYSWSWRGATH